MRINRDIRFSKDKSPYKDHLDLWFWTGDRKGWDSSGFFFRLTPDTAAARRGHARFEAARAGALPRRGPERAKGAALAATVAKLRKAGYEVGTESYKKTPAGIPADHPRAALLRHGGLHAGWEGKHPAALGTARSSTSSRTTSRPSPRCIAGCAGCETRRSRRAVR